MTKKIKFNQVLKNIYKFYLKNKLKLEYKYISYLYHVNTYFLNTVSFNLNRYLTFKFLKLKTFTLFYKI